MVEPNNWRGVAIQLDEFRKSIEERVGWLRALVWTLLGFVGTLIALVGGVYWLFGGLPDRITRMQDDIKELRSDFRGVLSESRNVRGELKDARSEILTALARIESKQGQPGTRVASLSESESKIIRDRLGLPPVTNEPGKFKIGDLLSEGSTKPLPDDLVAKLPKLKGARFASDINNALLLVDGVSGQIFAII